MNFYLDQTTNLFTRAIGLPSTVTTLNVKARDALAVDVQFHDGTGATGAWEWETLRAAWEVAHAAWEVAHAAWVLAGTGVEPVEPVEAPDLIADSELVFAVKASRADAAAVYGLVTAWTRVGLGRYRAFLNLNTETLVDTIVDLDVLAAVGEFTWSADGTSWESSNTLAVRIENDVYKGVEGTPLELPTPEEWLLDRQAALSGAVAPTAPGTYVGQQYRDTVTSIWYRWTGTVWQASPTDYEITSAQGRRLIASLKVDWGTNAGLFYFATTKPTAGQITVKTSTGYARIIGSKGLAYASGGTGVAGNSITLALSLGESHRAYAVMSTASLSGTTRSGDITYLGLGSSYNNQLTAIDVAGATALTTLSCYGNQLTELDVSNNTLLTILSCLSNQLKSLDVSNNALLTILECYTNQLTALDVSANVLLTNLSCSTNQLTTLDVGANTLLTNLSCSNNLLPTAVVDQILVDLDALNVDGNGVYLGGTGNGAASASGIAAAVGLVAEGWTPVVYN